jgi:hypothetical protein
MPAQADVLPPIRAAIGQPVIHRPSRDNTKSPRGTAPWAQKVGRDPGLNYAENSVLVLDNEVTENVYCGILELHGCAATRHSSPGGIGLWGWFFQRRSAHRRARPTPLWVPDAGVRASAVPEPLTTLLYHKTHRMSSFLDSLVNQSPKAYMQRPKPTAVRRSVGWGEDRS